MNKRPNGHTTNVIGTLGNKKQESISFNYLSFQTKWHRNVCSFALNWSFEVQMGMLHFVKAQYSYAQYVYVIARPAIGKISKITIN